ncbi:DNA helicase [Lithospermum erythrorhizon]|uniref:DNA helicase n=1 Tax=Lithospermum erythrorhizon TaxID=34254 RepID=A0AAV3PZV9_LITER
MRARDDPAFTDFLMKIGDGDEPTNDMGQVAIPSPMVIPFTTLEASLDLLVSYVYPNLDYFKIQPFDIMKRSILSPKNEFVDDINSMLIDHMNGEAIVYMSDDRANNVNNQGDYIDYLNTLERKGLPQHRLVLKENCPIVLLHNINPFDRLCNGTRLICKVLRPNVIGVVIATGQFVGKLVWIPRIPLAPNPADNKYLIPFVKRQIPVHLCFAMTISKAQGQTLDFVGTYLKQPVFSHGQLYVALSQARLGANVKLLIVPLTCSEAGTNLTTNVVYKEVRSLESPCSKSGAKYKRYVVSDSEGNEILAIAFSSIIPPISNTLKAFEVFKFTNADIQESSKEYHVIHNNDLQWVLRRSNLIRHMPLETPNLSTLARDIVPFGRLAQMLPNQGEKKAEDISIDILGVVIRADNKKSANSPYGPGTLTFYVR